MNEFTGWDAKSVETDWKEENALECVLDLRNRIGFDFDLNSIWNCIRWFSVNWPKKPEVSEWERNWINIRLRRKAHEWILAAFIRLLRKPHEWIHGLIREIRWNGLEGGERTWVRFGSQKSNWIRFCLEFDFAWHSISFRIRWFRHEFTYKGWRPWMRGN